MTIFDLPAGVAAKIQEISLRMSRGGYVVGELGIVDLAATTLYSIRFYSLREGESDIHATGQNDIVQIFQAALNEAHKRYRERRP